MNAEIHYNEETGHVVATIAKNGHVFEIASQAVDFEQCETPQKCKEFAAEELRHIVADELGEITLKFKRGWIAKTL